MNNQIYIYKGTDITFQLGDGKVMVNATEMAKPFGKRTADWLENQYAKRFIEVLTVTRKSVRADFVVVKQGGNDQGTWFHEDVALEFARWLSPQFGIWCNDRIKELITKGYTRIDEILDSITRRDLAQWLWEAEEAKDRALAENNKLTEKIKEDKPKVVFANTAAGSENVILVREFAKILCDKGFEIGEKRLYQWFRDKGYLNSKNEPYQRYVNMGLFKVIERAFSGTTATYTRITTKITGKGQIYFADRIINAA